MVDGVPRPKPKMRRYGGQQPLIDVGGAGKMIAQQAAEEQLLDPVNTDDGTGIVDAIGDALDYGKTPEEKYKEIQTQTDVIYDPLVEAGWISADHSAALNASDYIAKRIDGDSALSMTADHITQDLSAGALSIPGQVAGTVALGRMGIETLYDYFTSDDSLAEAFAGSIIDEKSLEALAQAQEDYVADLRERYPDITEKELAERLTEYSDSDAFQYLVYQNMPADLEVAMMQQWQANRLAGMMRRPDELQPQDDVFQAMGSAVVGIPAAFNRAGGKLLQQTIMKQVQRKIQNSILGRAAKTNTVRVVGRGLEALTPITMPLNVDNYMLNAGVGAVGTVALGALQEGMAAEAQSVATGAPIPPPKPEEIEQIVEGTLVETFGEESTTEEESYNIAAAGAGVLGLGVLTGKIKPKHIVGGKTFDEQLADAANVDEVARPSGPATSMGNAVDGLTAIKNAGEQISDDVGRQLEAEASVNTGVAAQHFVDEFTLRGNLDGLSQPTVPLNAISRGYRRLAPEQQQMFDELVTYDNALRDRAIAKSGLQEQINELQNEIILKGDNNKLPELARLKQQLDKYEQGIDRPNLNDLSDESLKAGIARASQDADVVKLSQMYTKMVQDLAEFRFKQGEIDRATADQWKASRPMYMPLRQDPYEGAAGMSRKWAIFKDKFNFGDNKNRPAYGYNPASMRDLSDNTVNVTRPMLPLEAIGQYADKIIKRGHENKARRRILRVLSRAEKPSAVVRHRQSYKQSRVPGANPDPRGEKYIAVADRGMIDYYDVPDEALRASLRFAPGAYVPVLSDMRRMFQSLTTGPGAPFFATKAYLWDSFLLSMIGPKGRKRGGVVDALGDVLAGDAGVRAANYLPDPTVFLSGLYDALMLATNKTKRHVAEKIVEDLATNSGVFAALASNPRTKAWLNRVAQTMYKSFNESAYGVMLASGAVHGRFLDDINYAKVRSEKLFDVGVPPIAREAVNSYIGLLDSLHNGARAAYFTSNYAALSRKYKGKVPKGEVDKLITETKKLTGDPSRQGTNPWVTGTLSAIPYANVSAQALMNFGRIIRQQPDVMATRLMMGLGLPVAYSMHMMSNWDQDASDYWFEHSPSWKRSQYLPIPTAETVVAWASGQQVPFTPNAIYEIPIPHEFMPIKNSFEAGLAALGLYQPMNAATQTDWTRYIGEGLMNMLPMPSNPLIGVYDVAMKKEIPLTHGGIYADNLSADSETDKTSMEMLNALFGPTVKMMIDGADAFEQSIDNGDQFDEAAGRALGLIGQSMRDRGGDAPIFNETGQLIFGERADKRYKYSQSREYVSNLLETFDPIFKQGSVERDRSKRNPRIKSQMGVDVARIADPTARAVAQTLHNAFKRGEAYKLGKQRTDNNAFLTYAQSQAASQNATERRQLINHYTDQINLIDTKMAEIARTTLEKIDNMYGDKIEEVTGGRTPKHITQFVEKSVR